MLDGGEKFVRAALDDYNRRNLAPIAEITWADIDKASQIVSGIGALPEKEKRAARRDLDVVMSRLSINFPTLERMGFHRSQIAQRNWAFNRLKEAYEKLGGLDPENWKELYSQNQSPQDQPTKSEKEDENKAKSEKENADKAEAKKQNETKDEQTLRGAPVAGATSGGGALFAPTSTGESSNAPSGNASSGPSDAPSVKPRQPYPGARTKTSLRKFARMQQAAADRPFGISADDLDHNFLYVHLKPVSGNNAPYLIKRDGEGYELVGNCVFDACVDGRLARYRMFASKIAVA
jgi:hypothetical protein